MMQQILDVLAIVSVIAVYGVMLYLGLKGAIRLIQKLKQLSQ